MMLLAQGNLFLRTGALATDNNSTNNEIVKCEQGKFPDAVSSVPFEWNIAEVDAAFSCTLIGLECTARKIEDYLTTPYCISR